jgi:DNA-3-methyladenine glycosylase
MLDDFAFLEGEVTDAAKRLLGCLLVRELDGHRLVARIVETEAYHQTDAASHSYKGRTPRTDVMFGPTGHLYVYFTYGMHYCMNIVTGAIGEGSAVLIRAVEPLEGQPIMQLHRHGLTGAQLTNGPAKVCQALAIDKTWNGHDLHTAPVQLQIMPPLLAKHIVSSTRIGISKDVHRPWRFFVQGNGFVSRP